MRVLYASRAARRLAPALGDPGPGVSLHPVTTAAEARAVPSPQVAYVEKSREFDAEFHRWLLAQPSLRWLQVGGSGYEHLGTWDAGRVTVTNSAGLLAPFLAQTCLGAIISMNNHLFRYRDQQAARDWTRHAFRPLTGQTLAIVGMGEIGRRLGAMARAAGLRVIGLRRTPGALAEADEIRPPEALMATLAEADIVSLHLRLDATTRRLFDASAFAAMKAGALFLNTGRGGLVDEAALIAALDRLGGAYLDVFETEPLPQSSPLWTHPKVVLSPHASDNAEDWPDRFARFFAENLARWQAGEPLANRVTP